MKIFNFSVLLACFLLALPSTSFALSLDEAKAQGLVGEKVDGYLGAVQGSTSGDVQALVADINSQRKALYQSIAKQNGTSLPVVEKLAGEKAIQKTTSGQYVNTGSGWKKK